MCNSAGFRVYLRGLNGLRWRSVPSSEWVGVIIVAGYAKGFSIWSDSWECQQQDISRTTRTNERPRSSQTRPRKKMENTTPWPNHHSHHRQNQQQQEQEHHLPRMVHCQPDSAARTATKTATTTSTASPTSEQSYPVPPQVQNPNQHHSQPPQEATTIAQPTPTFLAQ